MTAQIPLRLYIFGLIDGNGNDTSLTVFGEYKAARALTRVRLTANELTDLSAEIANLRGFVEGGYPVVTQTHLQKIGSRLFEILINEQIENLFFFASGNSQGRLLPLEILAEDVAVASWPWEFLYNSRESCFVAQDSNPVSRSIFSIKSQQDADHQGGPIRVLMILGVPPDDPATTPAEEVKAIREVFEAQLGTDDFILDLLPASDFQKLQSGIDRGQADIVHYFGHAGFDLQKRQGYLAISRPGADPFRLYASVFANLLIESGVRLVFLNACKTAFGTDSDTPGRSSVAATLLDRGIPAVIGTQFSLPDISAHSLSSTIYRALLVGKPIGEAVRIGRNAMTFAASADFFDWGIPVLFSTNAARVLFPRESGGLASLGTRDTSPAAFSSNGPTPAGQPITSAVVERTRPTPGDSRVRVALVDIDSKVGFLADVARQVNEAQQYYSFEVAYAPVPSGYVRTDLGELPQTYVPRLSEVLLALPQKLEVKFVCALTQNLVSGPEKDVLSVNLFTASVPEREEVFVVSTHHLRNYASEAGTSFAKATLVLCLGMLVSTDARWGVDYHDETVGCLFDYCEQRDDIVVSLRHMRLDHEPCRARIKNKAQLEAIDAILALVVSEAELSSEN